MSVYMYLFILVNGISTCCSLVKNFLTSIFLLKNVKTGLQRIINCLVVLYVRETSCLTLREKYRVAVLRIVN